MIRWNGLLFKSYLMQDYARVCASKYIKRNIVLLLDLNSE